MFGIGIIGCGKIAQVRHIPEYAAHPEAKLVGFYDINQQRAAELAAKYGGRAYATVEELLAEPEIQAVSICAAAPDLRPAILPIRNLYADAAVTRNAARAGRGIFINYGRIRKDARFERRCDRTDRRRKQHDQQQRCRTFFDIRISFHRITIAYLFM